MSLPNLHTVLAARTVKKKKGRQISRSPSVSFVKSQPDGPRPVSR